MLFILAALVIVIAGLREAATFLVPFLLAVFIAVICARPLFWLKQKRVPTGLAIFIIALTVLVIGLIIVALIGTSVNDFTRDLPVYQARLQEKARLLLALFHRAGINLPDQGIVETFDPGVAMKLVAVMLNEFKSVLTKGFMIMLLLIFILLEASGFPAKIRQAFDTPEVSLGYFDKFVSNVQHYIAIKTLVSLATGIIITIWLFILGVDYPLLWGLLAFLLNYIPAIGSIIAAVPAVLLALIQLGPLSAGLTAIGYLVVNMAVGNFIEPKIMGKELGLSTLVVFISLIFWGWVFGPVGMLLAVPLTMIVKIALDSNEDTRWVAVLLGN